MKSWLNSFSTSLVVASGGTDSPQACRPAAQCSLVEIHAPATLAEATTIQVAPHDSEVYRTLQSGGVDVGLAQSKSLVLHPCPDKLRIHLGGAAGEAHTFPIVWR